jgi:hypothetical protein
MVGRVTPDSLDESEGYKILGTRYFPGTDTLAPSFDNLHAFDSMTTWKKKHAAGLGARVFDVFGLFSPMTLRAKVLRQEMDLNHPAASWHYHLLPDEKAKWVDYVKQVDQLEGLRFPRILATSEDPTIQREIHLFTDASKIAIGLAIYCVQRYAQGPPKVALVFGKNNMVPIKQRFDKKTKTEKIQEGSPLINRLELTAAMVGSVMLKMVRENLAFSPNEVFCWTDSENVLRWLKAGLANDLLFVRKKVVV